MEQDAMADRDFSAMALIMRSAARAVSTLQSLLRGRTRSTAFPRAIAPGSRPRGEHWVG